MDALAGSRARRRWAWRSVVLLAVFVLMVLLTGYCAGVAGAASSGFTGLPTPPSWAARSRVHFFPALSERQNSAASRGSRRGRKGELGRECEPSYCPEPPLLYHGGKGVQHSPHIYAIFWGKNWTTSPGTEVHTELLKFYEGLSGSAYQGILTQYFDATGRISSKVSVTAYTDTSVSAPTSVNNTKIQAEVTSAISANKWTREANAQFVVLTAPGSTYESGFDENFCGYHSITSEGESSYTFIPYIGDEPFHAGCAGFDPKGNSGNVTSMIASHEYAESATDPDPGDPTWEASNATSELIYEIGDICASGDNELPNGSWVQGLWDDHQSACSLSDAEPPHVYAITGQAAEATGTAATLLGTINPEGLETKYDFEYGTTTSYGTIVPVPAANGGSGTANAEVSEHITGLSAGATYHYRLVATNSTGTTDGEDHTLVSGVGFAHSRVHPSHAVCPPASAGHDECFAIEVPTVTSTSGEAVGPLYEGSGEQGGYSPSDLRSAYKLSETGGSGQTVAIIDAYDDPNAYSDMATYRKTYKLKECTESSGCFKKVNQKGESANYPEANAAWSGEISLDVDMVSAVCPECHILLLEAKEPSNEDLYAAENEAATLGATEITNSFGRPEFSEETWVYDKDFDHPGIPITVAAGNDGYGVEYPAASPYVISVGGTALKKNSEVSRGWTEEVWRNTEYKVGERGAGTDSGCSSYEGAVGKPRWQPAKVGCEESRIDNDAAAVASCNTPLSVYDTYRHASTWEPFCGTSAASPIVAGIEALSSSFSRSIAAEAFYVPSLEELFDVTKGSDGECKSAEFLCTAEVGYDGPTGWGASDGPLKNYEGTWSVATPANPSEAKETMLSSSSCVGNYECIAVGYNKNSAGTIVPLAESSTVSRSWELKTPVTPSGATETRLTSVSCTAISACTAVGYYKNSGGTFVTLAERWNGTKWEIETTVNPSEAKESRLLSTTCTSEKACRAMGYYENSAGTVVTLIESWNGTTWEQQESPNPSEAKESRLNGDFCSWASFCVSVGDYKNSGGSIVTLAENWRGSGWSVVSTPDPSGAKESVLSAAGCGRTEDCMAAGYYVNSSGTKLTLAERFNWGSWELVSTPNPEGAKESVLTGTSCESYTDCMATGYYVNSSGKKVMLFERWNGKEFKIIPYTGAKEAKEEALYGVSCYLSEWCAAVGGYVNGSGVPVSLSDLYD